MNGPKLISRRWLLRSLFYAMPAAAVADGLWWEPARLTVRRVQLSTNPTHRFVQFTDVHHKGNKTYLSRVVREINALSPDFVCFTGDIVEDSAFLGEALELFGEIQAPLYGVPGNHDYWSNADFTQIAECFAATGGHWLLDEVAETPDGKVSIFGSTCSRGPQFSTATGRKNLLLVHYPVWAEKASAHRFDLILAGHSHGGQVRLPFYGALMVPFDVGEFEKGLYRTAAGPLYVNPGIGWFYLKVRFCCRPELTVFEI